MIRVLVPEGLQARTFTGIFRPSHLMNELKERLNALGLSEEMTGKVIATVAEFTKSRLPASLHRPIDEVLAGKSPDLGGLLGGFFGR